MFLGASLGRKNKNAASKIYPKRHSRQPKVAEKLIVILHNNPPCVILNLVKTHKNDNKEAAYGRKISRPSLDEEPKSPN